MGDLADVINKQIKESIQAERNRCIGIVEGKKPIIGLGRDGKPFDYNIHAIEMTTILDQAIKEIKGEKE